MKPSPQISLRDKLTLIVMATTVVALIVCLTALAVFDRLSYREQLTQQLLTRAQIVANASTAALTFADDQSAAELLRALSHDPHLGAAVLYDATGHVFARYQRPLWPAPLPAAHTPEQTTLTDTYAQAYCPVVVEHRRIGGVILQSDLTQVAERIELGRTVSLMVLLVAVGIGYLLATRLQRLVSRPILELTQTSRAIAAAFRRQRAGECGVRSVECGTRDATRDATSDECRGSSDREPGSGRTGETASGATVNRGEGETTRRFADSPSRPLPVSPPRRLAASPSTLHSPLPGLRATKHAPDELGELVDGFNEMLAQIETRDAALLRAHNELEGRVAERTQALFISNARLKEEVDGHERARQESDALREKLQRAYEHLQLEAERRSAVQEALRRSEERFSKAFRASPVPLAILTRTTRMIVDVNDRFAELAGRPREAIIGQAMFSVPVWAEAETRARLEQSLSDGEPLRNWEGRILGPEAEMSRANAERLKAANSNAEKLKTEKLKSDFSISAFQDFSVSQKSVSREAARAALLSTEHFQLGSEPCVLVMTEDISERVNLEGQLRQAQKMEAIGQLASGVAHDFNNLLTIIQGYTQLVLASLPGEVEGARVDSGKLIVDNHTPPSSIHCPASTMRLAREALEKVTNATQRATQLTGQLLTFSRKQMLQPRPLDLNQVVANVTGMLKPLLGENVRLQYQSAAALPPVQGDAGMMEQVIVNLAVNARDAMPKGGDLIISTFTCELDASYRQYQPQATAGRFVCLQVSDTGLGMDATTLERIFEPFFTTKGVGKGTGLGLATAYGIVKQHRGWIEVASQVGVGTTFKIFLPSTTAPTEVENASPLHSVRGGDELIMVVEDEPALRELFISVLRNFGYQVIEASHGREALGVWHSAARKPAMLLTDMMMPEGMTGWELAEKLRAEEPGLKVVYTSGYSPELFGGKVKLHGRSNFLPKPFHPRTLAQTVRQCLDN